MDYFQGIVPIKRNDQHEIARLTLYYTLHFRGEHFHQMGWGTLGFDPPTPTIFTTVETTINI